MHAMRRVFDQIVLRIVVLAIVASVLIVPIGSAGTGTCRRRYCDPNSGFRSCGRRWSEFVMMRVVVEPGISVEDQHYRGSATLVVISRRCRPRWFARVSVSRGGADAVAEIGDTMNLSPGMWFRIHPGR